jgi:alpha-tubulin suppressor-like RCC1 family protein
MSDATPAGDAFLPDAAVDGAAEAAESDGGMASSDGAAGPDATSGDAGGNEAGADASPQDATVGATDAGLPDEGIDSTIDAPNADASEMDASGEDAAATGDASCQLDGGCAGGGPVPGLSGVVSIAAGGHHTCVVTSDGGVLCWGDNFDGDLGDGTNTPSSSPVSLSGQSTGAAAVVAGRAHTCAWFDDSSVACWGDNDEGQLGTGSTDSSSTLIYVGATNGSLAGLAAGGNHTCVVPPESAGESAFCWGDNLAGDLGDSVTSPNDAGVATPTPSDVPVEVSGLPLSGVVATAAGDDHTCAITIANPGIDEYEVVLCWGDNTYGELGSGSMNSSNTPVDVSGLPMRVALMAAGGHHTCAVTAAEEVWCWGDNAAGDLGNGGTAASNVAVQVSNTNTNLWAESVALGENHTCALTGNDIGLTGAGFVWCWGDNTYGQLGVTGVTQSLVPIQVPGLAGIQAIAAGDDYTCAVTSTGGVQCWGDNAYGQLGIQN